MAHLGRRLHSGDVPCGSRPPPSAPATSTAEQLFNKKFLYAQQPDWTYDVFSSSCFDSAREPQSCLTEALRSLESYKVSLNELKDRLSDKDIVQWHEHTNFTNLAGGIIQACKQRFRPELCTQAWCKFYEIVSTFPIVCIYDDELVTAHLCEAPGAFVTSLNHYLCSQGFAGSWQWRATTLNPYFEGNSLGHMIDDDRFLRHSLEFWEFGEDNTGDLFSKVNRQRLKQNLDQLGPVMLVTADGSIDCQNMPGEQEVVVSPLHYCEVLAALEILSPGGSFVVKLFTMFEYSTVCLMFLLNCTFQQVNVFKPATSKAGNSEVYVVCLQYKGHNSIPQPVWQFLSINSESQTNPVSQFPLDLPQSFLQQHMECCRQFMCYQAETIQSNLNLFGNLPEELVSEIQFLRNYCTEMYIERYQLQQICFYDKVGRYPRKKTKDVLAWAKGVNQKEPSHFKQEGTFRHRHSQSQTTWAQRVHSFMPHVIPPTTQMLAHCIQHGDSSLLGIQGDSLGVTRGRALSWVQSSRFCDNSLLSEVHDVCSHAQIELHLKQNQSDLISGTATCLGQILKFLYSNSTEVKVHDLSAVPSVFLQCLEEQWGPSVLQVNRSPVQMLDSSLVYVDVTCCGDGERVGTMELKTPAPLIQSVTGLLSTLPVGSTVIVHLHTVLTRYTAGMLYLLYHCFSQMALECPGFLLADQFLVCRLYEGCPPWILHHLTNCQQSSISENEHILEIVPIIDILADEQFVTFLKVTNERVLQSFMNIVISEEKKLYECPDHIT